MTFQAASPKVSLRHAWAQWTPDDFIDDENLDGVRLRNYIEGRWFYQHLQVFVELAIEVGPQDSRLVRFYSRGCGGLESDMSKKYAEEVVQEEIQELLELLPNFGIHATEKDLKAVWLEQEPSPARFTMVDHSSIRSSRNA